ncbi:metallophosphatase [Polaribacter reichenbachii]|uniref:Metallophosphatase n=1 Tax=Polaribacter reichenbachii TaxID=996801 RepID=A0A1B8U1F3_9FLAO|nr:metallophosphoesterase [Polaribacter reichenbachii]APZ47325.1 metallophosphatase [Polaribacter reichenbachii]AUC17966.1 metallophosphatase [Polaribacter reichenbachii]OBY65708.1 metallophosphatase [Polaribacter reichenbachii]
MTKNNFSNALPGLLVLLFILTACHKKNDNKEANIKIAFLSDVHLGDIYGSFQDNDYNGVLNPLTGKYTLARTMGAQLKSTRLFNENYFAFLAALDDVAKRGVKYVVLPGDFSDDGQLINIRGLKRILNSYREKYDIQFITTTGNHDPVKPFYQDAGKIDFLGIGGKSQAIFSKRELFTQKTEDDLEPVITEDIAKLGYQGVLNELKDFGFFPKKNDVYWETPFTNYSYKNYDFKEAEKQAEITNRTYKLPETQQTIPDVSYLVEPADNLWFLAIDANVYVPKEMLNENNNNPENFNGASIGYNNVLTHKVHLLKWIKSVTKRANDLGKTLIVFSHYPMVDFNDDATSEMKALFGANKMQLHRVPNHTVAQALSEAGVKVHFGGHMHINDTGIRNFKNGKSLINIQIPSLAAYIPGYKLLTLKSHSNFEVETIVIDAVPNFNSLFPLYKQEHEYLSSKNNAVIWNKDVLKAKTYKEFTTWHLEELVRLRFLKSDWPEAFKKVMLNATGKDLLLKAFKNEAELNKQNLSLVSFENWTGLDMINDFYKLRSADKLAFTDIKKPRLKAYKELCNSLKKSNHKELKLWATIFLKTMNGKPANHFKIDLESYTITTVNPLY